MGFQNMCGNFSGIAAPIITGLALDWSGSFAAAFLIAAGMSAIGILSWWLIVQDVRPVDWATAPVSPIVEPAALLA
jgi:dipeptide/tripeptide permease